MGGGIIYGAFRDRLMAGRKVLALVILVRIQVSEPSFAKATEWLGRMILATGAVLRSFSEGYQVSEPIVFQMKNTLGIVLKSIAAVFLFLLWFVFIQSEYEMITKPELRSEFPIIKGTAAVTVFGLITLIVLALGVWVSMSLCRDLKKTKS